MVSVNLGEDYRERTILATAVLLLITGICGALQCHECNGPSTNAACNTQKTTCSEPGHNACYNRVQKMEAFGVKYIKGCMEMSLCETLASINNGHKPDERCASIPSDCYHCCNDKDLCNAFNEASKHTLFTWKSLIIALMISTVIFSELFHL